MKVLFTGSGGGIGTQLRPMADDWGVDMRWSDVADPPNGRNAGEEWVLADLTDYAAVAKAVEGCDAIMHFGGISIEDRTDPIHAINVGGTYNIYEAARKAGTKRIFFASSNHAVGFHTRETRLDADSPPMPDSIYGVSKVYGEALAQLYWQKFGIETMICRIGSCFPEPKDRRMLATWMSARDMWRLLDRFLKVPRLGCPVVYGVSNNDEQWWDNSKVAYLGWQPQDNSATFAHKHPDLPAEDPSDPAVKYVGGNFAKVGHFED